MNVLFLIHELFVRIVSNQVITDEYQITVYFTTISTSVRFPIELSCEISGTILPSNRVIDKSFV